MMTIVYRYTMYGKVVKRIDPKGSHYKKKYFHFFLSYPYGMMDIN